MTSWLNQLWMSDSLLLSPFHGFCVLTSCPESACYSLARSHHSQVEPKPDSISGMGTIPKIQDVTSMTSCRMHQRKCVCCFGKIILLLLITIDDSDRSVGHVRAIGILFLLHGTRLIESRCLRLPSNRFPPRRSPRSLACISHEDVQGESTHTR